jgi:Protein of unknown function (DUF2971)
VETVYKYCGKHGITMLRNLELLVRPPNQFNDPFKFTPKMICSDPVRYATRNLEREPVLKRLYEMLVNEKTFSGSFDRFQTVAKEQRDEWIKILAQAPQHTLPEGERKLLDEVSKQFGVLCMSGRRDSILMWGHYCDKPFGLVIGFDKSSAVFQQGKGLRRVDYVKERVVFDSCWEEGTPEMDDYNHKVIFSKSDVWSYEEEFRQFFWLSKLSPKPLEDGTLGRFLSFRAEAIVSVTLEPRCSPELRKDVRELLAKPDFCHVKLDRAVLNKDNFVIEFEPVD